MNIRIQQLNPIVGDIEGNIAGIRKALEQAEADEIELLVLPEASVVGYPPMDLLEHISFLEAVYRANENLVESVGETALLFGTVTANPSTIGRKCFNSALLAHRGKLVGKVHKTLLPTYDVFDDLRYFEPNTEFKCIEFKEARLGITICEDIWYNENDIQYHTYETNPARELVEKGADCILNLSASPFTKTKPVSRQQMLQNHARDLGVPLFYANQVGANTELVFDGDSMAIDAGAKIIARAPLFEESRVDVDWDVEKGSLVNRGSEPAEIVATEEGIFKALTKGLNDYLEKTGLTDEVILGLSGGIDSAVVACIAAEALGSEQVWAVTMPSKYSSGNSVSHSEELAVNLDIKLDQFSIDSLYRQYLEVFEPEFADTEFGVAEENLQSRIRCGLLMSLSNKFGNMLLYTGNKSELATGYSTLYGDMAGGLGIISDLYKTEVYALANWLNTSYYEEEVIPEEIIQKAPSAELRPNQKDSDHLPDYEILDEILELYVEKQYSAKEIAGRGFDKTTVSRVISLITNSEYKRFQSIPGLKVSTKAFGSGRRWPLVQGWNLD